MGKTLLLIMLNCTYFGSCWATVWHVGPSRAYKYCSEVMHLVQSGDTVQIDFAVYFNDKQVNWSKDNLYIVGVGGRPRLEAGSTIANDVSNGKGIFVISGSNIKVENIEFANAVVKDHNGAGIRQEGKNLHIAFCTFRNNEMGILCGNILNCKTTIEYSDFFNGGSNSNPGYQHNVYINHIDTLIFRFNYSHDAIAEGHELKSRATYNMIMYNRISNENSIDSRTIDIPNGGTLVLVGNIIEQGPLSANTNLLGYGLEGLTNPAPHHMWICNNTFINKKSKGSFIHIAGGTDTVYLKNNILAGAATAGLIIGNPAVLDSSNNIVSPDLATFNFIDETNYNYNLKSNSPAIDAGTPINKKIGGYTLMAEHVYVDTCSVAARQVINTIDIGAYEYYPPSFEQNTIFSDITVFPNPFSTSFLVRIENTIVKRISLFQLNGMLIQEFNTTSCDVGHLDPGIYLLVILTDKGSFYRKVVKN